MEKINNILYWNKSNELEELPQSQKDFIDQRLGYIKNYPEQLIPIGDFIKELELNDDN